MFNSSPAPFENRVVYEVMKKHKIESDRPRWQYIMYNTAHAHCMVSTEIYRQTLGICNIYCFSIATIVAQTWLIVTFIVILAFLLNCIGRILIYDRYLMEKYMKYIFVLKTGHFTSTNGEVNIKSPQKSKFMF